ncbi:hypothetical protein KHA90_24920 [Flavobacterium psychroterrae]|uniref:Uncharacterized protein n=1 Tax=Flavobacterium psychroterrae TaxID=2133767 RepID=A0ABS5PIT0_9FLAO|nr:hypothetical protein [Flavobacterium psychroterrae]MBS7234244.1 hypothetical protein [Flavobacterium psychroterrae]
MKKVTHYFVYVGHSTQTKNKLQEEFCNYLRSLQHTLIDAAKINDLKKEIRLKALELNEKHKRCAALVIGFSDLYTKTGFGITGFYFLTFQILQAHYDSN